MPISRWGTKRVLWKSGDHWSLLNLFSGQVIFIFNFDLIRHLNFCVTIWEISWHSQSEIFLNFTCQIIFKLFLFYSDEFYSHFYPIETDQIQFPIGIEKFPPPSIFFDKKFLVKMFLTSYWRILLGGKPRISCLVLPKIAIFEVFRKFWVLTLLKVLVVKTILSFHSWKDE